MKLEPHLITGHAVTSILEIVERQRFELLVIGYMGHSALYNRLIGSMTDRVVELRAVSGPRGEVTASGIDSPAGERRTCATGNPLGRYPGG